MKRVVIALMCFASFALLAQKEIKPSISKAEKALKEGKLDEAKAIIDITVADQGTMVDKKGQPSKNAAKAWFIKGVTYAAIDTTKNEKFKALDPNPFPTAQEAFKKVQELDNGKTDYFLTDAIGLPLLNININANFANAFYLKAVADYQDKKDYKAAFANISKTIALYPDTAFLNAGGVFFATQAGEDDTVIDWLTEYLKKGGKSSDAYVMLFSTYRDKKKDNAKALEILKEARQKFPNNAEFAKYELNIYITNKQYDLAKNMIEADLKANPNDKESLYLLGELNKEMKDTEGAKQAFQKAFDLDPTYFDAIAGLTDLIWLDAKAIKDEMGKLGITKPEMAKRQALDKQYVEKLKTYLPYVQKCEKLQPDNINILYQLLNVYTDLDDQPNIALVKKKLKRLGEDVD
jgi:tetratricopeptide (TPR) repeat protein